MKMVNLALPLDLKKKQCQLLLVSICDKLPETVPNA